MGAEGDRHEPWLQVDLSSRPQPHASLTFMQDAKARAESAGLFLWLLAGAALVVQLAVALTFILFSSVARRQSGANVDLARAEGQYGEAPYG